MDSGRCLIWALSIILAQRAQNVRSGLTGSRDQIFSLTSLSGGGASFLDKFSM
jgi:hypothetical protein